MYWRLIRVFTFATLLAFVYLGSRVALVLALAFLVCLIEGLLADLPFLEAEEGVVERLRRLLQKDD